MFCGYIVSNENVVGELQQQIVEKRHEQKELEQKLGSKYQTFTKNENIEQILFLGPIYLILEHCYGFGLIFTCLDILLCYCAYYYFPIFHTSQFSLLLTFCILRVLYSYLFNPILLRISKKKN